MLIVACIIFFTFNTVTTYVKSLNKKRLLIILSYLINIYLNCPLSNKIHLVTIQPYIVSSLCSAASGHGSGKQHYALLASFKPPVTAVVRLWRYFWFVKEEV